MSSEEGSAALNGDTTLIEANRVQLTQRRAVVLEDVSFSIQRGEFVYLVGRTGAGKSSLLRTLFADLKPTAGSLRVDKYRIERIADREVPYLRRRLGIVFQDFQLLPDRSVGQNLSFALGALGWRDTKKIRARVAEVLDRVELANKAASFPHQLSGGEQQRVAIARALLNEPQLLLADEPTGNLDPETATTIHDLIVEINHAGTAVLMATHAMALLQRAPARVLEVRDGTVVDRGRLNPATAIFA